MVYGLDNGALAQVALIFPGFGSQNVTGKCMASFDLTSASFAEALGSTPVGLDFRHCPSPYFRLFRFRFRGDDDEHAAPFHFLFDLYNPNILQLGGEVIQGIHAQFLVGDFSSTKNNRNLRFITLFEESPNMFYLELQVMFIGLGPQLDLFQLNLYLLFLGFLQFFTLLILKFAVVHDPANRWHGSR